MGSEMCIRDRPISLLNTSYKLLSGSLAERLKPCLNKIISHEQKAYVPGRYIGEVTKTCYDILHYAKENNTPGLILLIDFEKAFDSISHSMILKTLRFFGFYEGFIKWVKLLLTSATSSINLCGTLNFSRGCRQGDPISALLFILAVEVLSIKIKTNPNIDGFRVGNFNHTIDMYADDVTLYLNGSELGLKCALSDLEGFYQLSGLKINLGKCNAVWIGSKANSPEKLCRNLNLIWTNTFRLLGIDFTGDIVGMNDNFKGTQSSRKNF